MQITLDCRVSDLDHIPMDETGYDFDVSNTKYNQLKEFIPDKENYTIYKDMIMIDIDKPIKLNSEFDNLKTAVFRLLKY